MQTPAVQLRDVSKSFGGDQVLSDINLSIAPGEFVVFVGASGCGKSTLLRLIAGLIGDLKAAFDPERIAVGGGIGLAGGLLIWSKQRWSRSLRFSGPMLFPPRWAPKRL